MQKDVQLSFRGFSPDSWPGALPWISWGLCPQAAVIGSLSKLTVCPPPVSSTGSASDARSLLFLFTFSFISLLFYWRIKLYIQAASSEAKPAAGDGSSGSRGTGIDVSGLLLHNAMLKDGRLVVCVGEHGTSPISVKLQLTDSTRRPPTSTTSGGHLSYRCPVHMRQFVAEISLPCEDSAACCQHDVYLSCSEL